MKSSAKNTESATSTNASFFQSDKGNGTFFAEDQASSATFFAPVQTKLTIGAPNDPYEQEADAMADRIVGGEVTGAERVSSAAPGIQQKPAFESPGIMDLHSSRAGQLIQGKEATTTPNGDFSGQLASSKGAGSGLPRETRSRMEGGFGADFSQVRVHTGSQAAHMSASIGARAFTHGSDIYFNEGEYQPGTESGDHLIAHELTHTVQQGAVSAGTVSRKPSPNVQASFLDGLGDWLGGVRDRIVNFVRSLPGYFLLAVILGSDPITGERVERNGLNFIRGFMLMLPSGQRKYDELRTSGKLNDAALWIDQQLAMISLIGNMFRSAYQRAKNSLSASDLLDIGGAFTRIRGYFAPAISRAMAFASQVSRQILRFIKDALLNSLVDFIRNRTRAYPLLRIILGRDPITGEEVPRTMENVIHGFLMLTETGEQMYNKMQESGALQRSIDWMRAQIATLPTVAEVMGAFTRVWQELSFDDIFRPVAAFTRIYNTLADPVGRILRFVGAVAWQILLFIKDALLGWLRQNANHIPGYSLLSVILGRDIFTQERVPRTVTNIIRGFMGLIPGGEAQFQQMQESGVIPRAAARINQAIESLGISWAFIRGLFSQIWDSFRITDLLILPVALARVMVRFREPISRLVRFVGVVIMIVIELLLRMVGFPVDLLGQVIANARAAIDDIKRDPMGFLRNLLRAVKRGFERFFGNFVSHLLGGLQAWLFGQVAQAGIEPPQDLSLRSLLGFVMRVLGITLDNILNRLAQRIGPERVARIRSAINTLSGVWSFLTDVMNRGPEAIWERIQSQISNLWDIIINGVRNWVMTRIIQRVTARLISMLDPTGIMAVVNSFLVFWDTVMTFIERLREILQMINSFLQGVRQIAAGSIESAAGFLENALARGLGLAIAWFARLVGLGSLGNRIADMIERARALVNRGIDWLLDRAIRLGGAVLNMGRNAVAAVRNAVANWWRNRVRFRAADGQQHTLYFQGEGEGAVLMIASRPATFRSFITSVDVQGDSAKQTAKTQALEVAGQLDAEKRRRISGGTDQERETAQQTKAANIQALLEQLRPHVSVLFGGGTPSGPPQRTFAGQNSVNFATGTHIIRLHLTNIPGDGSIPTSAAHATYDKINRRKTSTGASYYIRGHLLNHNLGGPGQWTNMVPLSRTGNHQHEAEVESQVKRAYDSGTVIEYNVVPVFTSRNDKGSLLQAIDASGEDATSKQHKREIVTAEDFVPTGLRCEAYALRKVGENQFERQQSLVSKTVNNPVERSLASYHLSAAPRAETLYLNYESDPDKIAQATGLTSSQAEDMIIERASRSTRFGSYRTLLRAAGLTDETVIASRAAELRARSSLSLGPRPS